METKEILREASKCMHEYTKNDPIDTNRSYRKFFIVDVHSPSGSICFIKHPEPHPIYPDKISDFTYDINKAAIFNDKEQAQQYLEDNSTHMLCPVVVDYRVAEAIAHELTLTHRMTSGNHAGQYIC